MSRSNSRTFGYSRTLNFGVLGEHLVMCQCRIQPTTPNNEVGLVQIEPIHTRIRPTGDFAQKAAQSWLNSINLLELISDETFADLQIACFDLGESFFGKPAFPLSEEPS